MNPQERRLDLLEQVAAQALRIVADQDYGPTFGTMLVSRDLLDRMDHLLKLLIRTYNKGQTAMLHEPIDIAQIAYVANAAYCQMLDEPAPTPWSHAPEKLRNRIIAGVIEAQNEPGRTPEQNHERWLEHMRLDGWVHGTKDEVLKQHPYMVPWGQLTPEQQRKDHLFLAIVRALS